MMTFFVVAVYFGGVFAMPDRKLGFWARIFWPVELGEWLHKRAIREGRDQG